jgi:hypothetical protein
MKGKFRNKGKHSFAELVVSVETLSRLCAVSYFVALVSLLVDMSFKWTNGISISLFELYREFNCL